MATALTIVLTLLKSTSFANDLYINQVGDDLTLTVTQDGENNSVRSLNTSSGYATVVGNDKTLTFSQTGDGNKIGSWQAGNNQTISITSVGNLNIATVDNHGDRNTQTIVQNGNSNRTHVEIGNGGDNDNTMTVRQNGDNQYAYVEADGDSNVIETWQGGGADSSFIRTVTTGDSNNIDIRQGKKLDGSLDYNDSGGHESYVTVTGSNNTIDTSQVNSNGTSSDHHMAHIITGDSNTLSHLQYGDKKKQGFIEATGDNNTVTLEQRNSQNHFANVELTGDGHTVTGTQRGGNSAHNFNVDLTNSGGAYTLSTNQNSYNAQTYSLTGVCATASGCAITVNQF